MRLSQLNAGESAVIVKILGHGAFRKRVIEMGFVKGRIITPLLSAPLRDPIKYRLMNYEVSLRRAEAHMVEVIPVDDAKAQHLHSHVNTIDNYDDLTSKSYRGQRHTINVALIGNPNCGKTSLFNYVTGAKEHVGNYSGVTVDAKYSSFDFKGYHINLIDLPGTYSLSAYSPEELYVRRYLRDEAPDVIINVVDASNLERNLYLTTELIDMDRSLVVALNMFDELESSGAKFDYKMLGKMIGVPIIPTISRNGQGINQLFETVIEVYEGTQPDVRHVHVNLGDAIESGIRQIKDEIKADHSIDQHFSARYLAIKFIENDPEVDSILRTAKSYDQLCAMRDSARATIEQSRREDVADAIAAEKYGFIAGALAETYTQSSKSTIPITKIIDTFVTNKVIGFPLFFVVMFIMFWATFQLGSYPKEWIECLVGLLSNTVHELLPSGPLKDMLIDGVIGGVGGVIVFLPQILILFFFISFMEDSGYMARAAFIMDRLMHRIGLHGKSFIPLVMGFGCNVPAISASRSIESYSSRLITILINPFMSCSARLPVYVLFIGTFFSAHAALVFMSLYLLGVLVAMVTARLLRLVWFKADETPFVMELPPYRMPMLSTSLAHMWAKGKQYLKKMGGIILVASIIVWALNYFPIHDEKLQTTADNTTCTVDDSSINPETDSYLEMIGKAITPVMKPLGFHWRATVAAMAGVPAKEITVSTLGVLYAHNENASDQTLSLRITQPSPITGKPDFSPAAALAFMVFVLLYCPCIATVTAIIKETGSWKYGAFTVVYNTAVAWIVGFIVYRLAQLF